MRTAARIDALPPYTPIKPYEVLSEELGIPVEGLVKLDANENPYGPSAKVRQALSSLAAPHIYPDPESLALRRALSAYTGLPPESLLAGAGADELIDLLLRVLVETGDAVLVCPPTFGMYAFDAGLNGARVVEVPRRADFSPDIPSICAAVERWRPKILFLAAPNNPDGSLPSQEEIRSLLDLPVLVVLDEAYVEFSGCCGNSGGQAGWMSEVPGRENLAVLRTFSKWAGLAGLRVGYGAFPGWLLPSLWKAKQPYNVSVAASAAAIASLEDLDYLQGNVQRLIGERERMYSLLQKIPSLAPYPSQANFILCRVKGSPALDLKNRLARQGILVRHYRSPELNDCIRISVGLPGHTDILAAALKRMLP